MRHWPSKISLLRHPLISPLLLISVVLALYYPALFHGIHTIDDPGIIALYSGSPPLLQILLPGSGYYYRPLVELFFWFDNLLWGMEPRTLHLENMLLHCANSILVYLLAYRITRGCDTAVNPVIPILAGLMFAVHPVNVEAVVWIAGRTDPLLTLFVLSALFFLLRWLEQPCWQDMVTAMVLFVAALLTKETALAFGVVAALLFFCWPGTATVRQRWVAVGFMVLPVLLLVFVIFFFRGNLSGLSRFITASDLQVAKGIVSGLTALGFYFRKILVPLPLNFAIIEVHPWHVLAGVAPFPILWWLYRNYRQAFVLFVSALLFVLPAVLVALKQVAWTPFAERYLYLPSAVFILGLGTLWYEMKQKHQVLVIFCSLSILAVFSIVTVQRTMLWRDPLVFYQDAIAKSPGFGSLYNELGGILIQNGKPEQAEEAFVMADRLNQRESMRLLIKANMMRARYVQGNFVGVREMFLQLFKQKKDAPADFLELLHKADSKRLVNLTGNDKKLLAQNLLETLDQLNQKRPDPFWLYRSGQIALLIEDNARASIFFRQSFSTAPADAHYKAAAGMYLRKLEQGI